MIFRRDVAADASDYVIFSMPYAYFYALILATIATSPPYAYVTAFLISPRFSLSSYFDDVTLLMPYFFDFAI